MRGTAILLAIVLICYAIQETFTFGSCPPQNPVGYDVLLPGPNCQSFYKCNSSTPILIQCPPGQEYGVSIHRCDWPEIANCPGGSSGTGDGSGESGGTLPTGCPPTNSVGSDVFLPGPDCDHFYKCNFGIPVLVRCPADLKWSQTLQRCDRPEVANCGGSVPTSCPPTTPVGYDVLLPGPDCEHFYKCNFGVPVLVSCPPDFKWSQALQRCDWPDVAKCRDGSDDYVLSGESDEFYSPPTGSFPTSCPATNPVGYDILLPGPDCDHFYKCNFGVPDLISCPRGLKWSQKLQQCDYPSIANCRRGSGGSEGSGSSGGSGESGESTDPSLAGCPPTNPVGRDVVLPGPDCDHFYKCNFGIPVLIPCPPGLKWNTNKQTCDWPEDANCS